MSLIEHRSTGRRNAYGILSEPSQVLADLYAAREAISQAIAFIDATKWPKDSDYDLV
jgi:hypothetical protein